MRMFRLLSHVSIQLFSIFFFIIIFSALACPANIVLIKKKRVFRLENIFERFSFRQCVKKPNRLKLIGETEP